MVIPYRRFGRAFPSHLQGSKLRSGITIIRCVISQKSVELTALVVLLFNTSVFSCREVHSSSTSRAPPLVSWNQIFCEISNFRLDEVKLLLLWKVMRHKLVAGKLITFGKGSILWLYLVLYDSSLSTLSVYLRFILMKMTRSTNLM